VPRTTKLTPELIERIAGLVRSGITPYRAAELCGIGSSTHYRWMESVREPYREYRESIKRAEAQWEADAIRQVQVHGQKHWQALAWMLERRFPERYGRPEHRRLDLEEVRRLTEREGRAAGLTEDEVRAAVEIAERIARGED
jgi:hypothetical protein